MKKLLLFLLSTSILAHGQAFRWSTTAQTVNSSSPQPGALLPALNIPNATIAVCTYPANGVPCTNYATTYTDPSGTTTCPGAAQLTGNNSAICIAKSDVQGNVGAWLKTGNYQYTVTTRYGSFGPYDITMGSAGVTTGTVSGQTANCLPKASSVSALTGPSAVCDNGTTVNSTLPIAAPSLSAPLLTITACTTGQVPFGDGTGACVTPGTGSISGLTNGKIPLATGPTVIGASSPLDYGITTAGTVTSAVAIAAPSETIGSPTDPNGVRVGAGGVIYTNYYTDKVVTLTAPGTGPTLSAHTTINVTGSNGSAATLTAGHVYKANFSFAGWNGETALSADSNTITATGGVALITLPDSGIPWNGRWVGIWLYLTDTTSSATVYRACVMNCFASSPPVSMVQPADQTGTFGGFPATYDTTLGAYAGTGATDKDGTAIPAPTSPPVLSEFSTIGASTVYGAYSYMAGDGTETALSPASSPVTISANGWVTLYHTVDPPSGAAKFCDYLSTDGVTWHNQQCVPIHYTADDLYTYNSGGAGNTPGAAQSTISPLQQALDAAYLLGATNVVMPSGSGPNNHSVPILIHTNVSNIGLKIQCSGIGGQAQNSNCRAPYTGTLTGVDNVVYFGWNIKWMGIDATDPNGRAGYGLAFGNYQANEAFHGYWEDSTFQGLGTHGVGCIIDMGNRGVGGTNGHSASEQYGDHATCAGESWGMELHGAQTFDIRFKNFSTRAANVNQIANSGDERTFGVRTELDGYNSDYHNGRYVLHLGGENSHPYKAIWSSWHVKFPYTEVHNQMVYLSMSSTMEQGGLDMVLEAARETKNQTATHFLVLNESPSMVTFRDIDLMQGDAYFNYGSCTVPTPTGNQYARFRIDGDKFNFQRSLDTTTFALKNVCPFYTSLPGYTTSAPIAFENENNQIAQWETDANGELVPDPMIGEPDNNPVIVQGGVNAINTAGTPAQLVPDPTFATGTGWTVVGANITVTPGVGAVSSGGGTGQLIAHIALIPGGYYKVIIAASLSAVSATSVDITAFCSPNTLLQVLGPLVTGTSTYFFRVNGPLVAAGCSTPTIDVISSGSWNGTITQVSVQAYPGANVYALGFHPSDPTCTGAVFLRPDGTCGAPSATPIIKQTPGDMACAQAADTTIGSNAITAGSATSLTGTATPTLFWPAGTLVGITGATPGGLNGGPYATSATATSSILTFAGGTLPATWTSGGTIFLWCANQINDAISATPYTYSNGLPLASSFFGQGLPVKVSGGFTIVSSSAAPTMTMGLNLNSTVLAQTTSAIATPSSRGPSVTSSILSAEWEVVPSTATLVYAYTRNFVFNSSNTGTNFGQLKTLPLAVSSTAQTLAPTVFWTATGVASGTYTSGGSFTGTVGQTCTLTTFNNSSTATATLALTGTNTVAGGTAIVVTARGQSASAAPTSATLGNGTATCSGSAALSTVLGGATGNALSLTSAIYREF